MEEENREPNWKAMTRSVVDKLREASETKPNLDGETRLLMKAAAELLVHYEPEETDVANEP
jgi:hypothetical protein